MREDEHGNRRPEEHYKSTRYTTLHVSTDCDDLNAHKSFSSIYHVVDDFFKCSKFERIEITPSIISDHNEVIFELELKTG